MAKIKKAPEDPLSRRPIAGRRVFGLKISRWWWFFIALALLMVPLIAHEAEADAVGAEPCGERCAWNAGSITAPIITLTVITPKEPEPRAVQVVRGYGNGTCVPYARARSGIRLYGNAAHFMEKAPLSGYATGTIPVVGAIMVTNESTGHVAVVEEVAEGKIRISEQNYNGLYIVSSRWLGETDGRIVGYIY